MEFGVDRANSSQFAIWVGTEEGLVWKSQRVCGTSFLGDCGLWQRAVCVHISSEEEGQREWASGTHSPSYQELLYTVTKQAVPRG